MKLYKILRKITIKKSLQTLELTRLSNSFSYEKWTKRIPAKCNTSIIFMTSWSWKQKEIQSNSWWKPSVQNKLTV